MALPGRRKNTSDKILDTTLRLLAEYGYANVNMRLIASEAGVALSQLTYHFVTKKKLINAVLDKVSDTLVSNIRAELASSDVREERLGSVSVYLRNVMKDPDILRVMVDFTAQAMWDDELRRKMNALCERISGAVNEVLTEGSPEDNAPVSAEVVSRFMLGAVYGISVQVLLGMDTMTAAQAAAFGERAVLGKVKRVDKNKETGGKDGEN